MNRDDLIERWKAIKLGPLGYCSEPLEDLINDTIAGLSPVLPEDVKDELKRLAKFVDMPSYRAVRAEKAIDLIERLAQNDLSYQRQINEMSQCLDDNQQRIEELDKKLSRKEIIVKGLKARVANWDELNAKIAEYEKALAMFCDYELWQGREDATHTDFDYAMEFARTELQRIRG